MDGANTPHFRSPDSESTRPSAGADDRLHSWKEIAVYLKRDVRTVRRWEKNQGLPVHRHRHQKAASVYAYRSELEVWWAAQRSNVVETQSADVESDVTDASAEGPQPPTSIPRAVWWWVPVVLAAIVIVAAAGYILVRRTGTPTGHRAMIAVLPFQNLTGDPGQEFISDGFTEEMITELGELPSTQLGVIARTSSMAYKNSAKTVDQIGRELGVEYVLEGSVRHWGGRVLVTAQLIQTRDQTHIWAQDFENEQTDILRLQGEIARAIADQVRIRLSGVEKARLVNARPVDAQVHELCLLGRYEWNKRDEQALTKAIGYFQKAIARDSNYAPAYAGLAEAYLVSTFYGHGSAREFYDKARGAAEHAIQLDEDSFQAHATLGMVKSSYLQVGAVAEFQRALQINPSYATAHHWYAFDLWRTGRHEDALAELGRARQLDPVSPIINTDTGVFLISGGQTEEAVRLLQRTIEFAPDFSEAHRTLALAYVQQKNFSAAIVEAQKAVGLNPNNAGVRATLGYVEAVRGRPERALKMLHELQQSNARPFFQAWIFTGLGDNDKALECLWKEYEERSPMMVAIAIDPIFQTLRSEGRFQDLLGQIRRGA